MKTIAFFNNKGGVGKTSLVYHLSWMFADLGVKVIAADLDPQANLTSMFLEEERLEKLWDGDFHSQTIRGAINPILKGTGDIQAAHIEEITDNIGLICGDLGLSEFEDKLSDAWPRCHDRDEAAFRCISAFYRIIRQAAESRGAEIVLIDVGPNLGAINRAAIIAAQHVVIPLAPDLFSLQGLKNLGPTLRRWRSEWEKRLKEKPAELILPEAEMKPVGYVLLQYRIRLNRPTKSYEKWSARIPDTYRNFVLEKPEERGIVPPNDPYCLFMLKHYQSLMPMAMEARKPIFKLLAADGVFGSNMEAVNNCRSDFEKLARAIAERCKVVIPQINPILGLNKG